MGAFTRPGDAPPGERLADALWPLLDHAQQALSSNEGVRLWMLDCGELVAKHRERAVAAEATLAKVAAYCQVRAAKSNRTLPRTVHVADILAIIGSEEEAGNGC